VRGHILLVVLGNCFPLNPPLTSSTAPIVSSRAGDLNTVFLSISVSVKFFDEFMV